MLAIHQLVATLKSLSVETVTLNSDLELLDLLRDRGIYAIISSNCRLVLGDRVQFIPFEQLCNNDVISAQIHTKDSIALTLGLPVQRMPELVALCSCDLSLFECLTSISADSACPETLVRGYAEYLLRIPAENTQIIQYAPFSNVIKDLDVKIIFVGNLVYCYAYWHGIRLKSCPNNRNDFLSSLHNSSQIPCWILPSVMNREFFSPWFYGYLSYQQQDLDMFLQPVRRLIYAISDSSHCPLSVMEAGLSVTSYPLQNFSGMLGGSFDAQFFRGKEQYQRSNDLHMLVNILGSDDKDCSLQSVVDLDPLRILSDTIFLPCGTEAPYKGVGLLVRLMAILSVAAFDSGIEVQVSTEDIEALVKTIYILHTEVDVTWLPAIEPSERSLRVASLFLAACQGLYDLANLLNITNILPQPKDLFSESLFFHLHAQSEWCAALSQSCENELCSMEVEEMMRAALATCPRLSVLAASDAVTGVGLDLGLDPFDCSTAEPDYDALLEQGEPSPIGAAAPDHAGVAPAPAPTPAWPLAEEEALPIAEHRHTILQSIAASQVTCIQGETGCGKSSMVPQYIVDDARARGAAAKVIVTQPRRIAAVTLAGRVAQQRGQAVGGEVGYRIGHGDHVDCDSTAITFVTIGYLLQFLCHNPGLIRRYTHLVLDEVHERSMDSDLLVLLVKKLLDGPGAAGLRVVIMSATLQAGLFGAYFAPPGRPAPEPIFVGVRRFPVAEVFLEDLAAAIPALRDLGDATIEQLEACRHDMSEESFRRCRHIPTRIWTNA